MSERKTAKCQPEPLWNCTSSFSRLINLRKKSLLLSSSIWQKGYEEASKIGIMGIAAKVAKDLEGYCKLQSHFPEQKTFIGKWFYSVSTPLFDEATQYP
ncbi:hypothetical protein VP01_214g6 [Puccinia sorghi]|uniref:Tet-like 2OG-Fe(II) oxygenase domain-containing protein n=1 Tax=Puccinia sorghi TaxID=27349 RepID=A0A0L6V9P6_9BASI|nr:hypothetical protein VP01_214g6 [Puccinia sorghi]